MYLNIHLELFCYYNSNFVRVKIKIMMILLDGISNSINMYLYMYLYGLVRLTMFTH